MTQLKVKARSHPKRQPNWTGYTIRFRNDDFDLIQDHWRQTFPDHGLSFNSWVNEAVLRRVADEQEYGDT